LAKVDPFVIQWPQKWMADDEIRPVIEYLNRFLHDVFIRTGGGDDLIDDSGENVASAFGLISRLNSLTEEAERKLEDIEQLTASLNNGFSRLEELKNNIENAEQTNNQQVLSRIEELESKIESSEQVKSKSSGLDELNNRISDLEQSLSDADNISGKFNSKVSGQDSSTDNAIARFNGKSGKIIQDSGILIDDDNKLILPTGSWSDAGIDIDTGDTYRINGTNVLTNTALGLGVITSKLETLGVITALVALEVNTTGAYSVDGTQVVSNQGAAVSDASGGATIDAEARVAINALLARVRVHGLIA